MVTEFSKKADENKPDFVKLMRDARFQKKITLSEIAWNINNLITQEELSAIEVGKLLPIKDDETWARVGNFLGIDIDEFIQAVEDAWK